LQFENAPESGAEYIRRFDQAEPRSKHPLYFRQNRPDILQRLQSVKI
jgi:hypothetical protein